MLKLLSRGRSFHACKAGRVRIIKICLRRPNLIQKQPSPQAVTMEVQSGREGCPSPICFKTKGKDEKIH